MEQILLKKSFSDKTLKVYLSIIKRLEKLKFKFPKSKNEKVEYIREFFSENKIEKASSRLDLLNLVIVLRTIQELPTEKLKQYRTELSKERLNNQVSKMSDLKDKLMSLPEFQKELMKAYEDEEWAKFIVNYLMMTYGTRNLDVDVNIVKSKKDATDSDQNYLILSKNKILWIRNKYKTFKTFGQQTHEITDPEFVRAVKKQGVGKLFSQGQLSNSIRKLLIDKMNEARIFKMIIDDAYDKKDTVRINELSKSRGTSISTIKSFYNVNAEDEVIKEI
jgi:ribosomal protein S24E